MIVMAVYYLLPDEQGDMGNHDWSSFSSEGGSIKKEFLDKIRDFIEDHSENSAVSDEDASKIEEMKKTMKNSDDSAVRQAGNEIGNRSRPIDNLGRNAINWSKILFQFTETKKVMDVWNRPNRKLNSIYPDAILPGCVLEEKEEVFICIDASSSINKQALSLFVDVVRNTPSRFKIKAISFDTMCYDYNIKGIEQPIGGGGTRFDILEQHIQTNCKKYPKIIAVLTDGCGNCVKPQFPERWCWLLYGECDLRYIDKMKHYKIMDLLKK
jgi:hypothetical protein